MADPLSADRLLAALRAEGCRVVEHRSWRTHNRNHKGRWGPVNGVMVHHTVTSGTASTVQLCYDGYAGLPGPLCHGVIAKDGTVHLVGHGRANHAGAGDGDVLRAVTAEDGTLPAPNEADTDGNARFYGFECINLGDGKDPWPRPQLDAIERATAALCRAHGWGERSVIGHLEWQPGKVDPRGFTMSSMRARIGKRLAGPAAGPAPARTEQQTEQQEVGVPLYVNLGRVEPMVVQPAEWEPVAYDRLWADETGQHVGGGSWAVRGPASVSGSVGIRVDGLPEGRQLQVRVVEVGGGEDPQPQAAVGEVIGTAGDAYQIVPVDGLVPAGRAIRVEVQHWEPEPVQVRAYFRAHVWER